MYEAAGCPCGLLTFFYDLSSIVFSVPTKGLREAGGAPDTRLFHAGRTDNKGQLAVRGDTVELFLSIGRIGLLPDKVPSDER